jgi:hypothetical protein
VGTDVSRWRRQASYSPAPVPASEPPLRFAF